MSILDKGIAEFEYSEDEVESDNRHVEQNLDVNLSEGLDETPEDKLFGVLGNPMTTLKPHLRQLDTWKVGWCKDENLNTEKAAKQEVYLSSGVNGFKYVGHDDFAQYPNIAMYREMSF